MLRRLHIDNFKSLVNFDLELDRAHLLLGRNGSGKTAMFAALSRVFAAMAQTDVKIEALFPRSSCTRWERRTRQTFELTVELESVGEPFLYRLEIEHGAAETASAQVALESLTVAGVPLFHRQGETVRLFERDGAEKSSILVLPEIASVLPHILHRLTDGPVQELLRWLRRSQFLSLVPARLLPFSTSEATRLLSGGENFASWYRHLTQEQPGSVRALEDELKQVFGPEFMGLRLARVHAEEGTARELRTEWRADAAAGPEARFELAAHELSEGQRALLCLYAVLHAAADQPALLCIDEPDNYVALSEIQPWLNALAERPHTQALLISHHPEIINLAARDALYFYRRGQGPSRVKPLSDLVHPDEALTAAELVARGWIDADS